MAEETSHPDGSPCCGACAHAAEVERQGPAGPATAPLLRHAVGDRGQPVGVTLVLSPRGKAQERVPATRAEMLLGRTPPADICVPMPPLSRRQCTFTFAGDRITVADHDSACGTFINGRIIHGPQALRQGDRVYVADLVIEVEIEDLPVAPSVGS